MFLAIMDLSYDFLNVLLVIDNFVEVMKIDEQDYTYNYSFLNVFVLYFLPSIMIQSD